MKQFCIFLQIIFWIIAGYDCMAQDTTYARRIIRTLSSPGLHGRGYVRHGDRKAARFIAGEFRKTGLIHYESSFYQPFKVSVNTFPTKIKLSINGRLLKPGIDFLVDPASPGGKGIYSILRISPKEILNRNKLIEKINNHPHHILCIDDRTDSIWMKKERQLKPELFNILSACTPGSCAGFVSVKPGKLSWSAENNLLPLPSFQFNPELKFDSLSRIKFIFKNRFIPSYQTQNVIGYIPGKHKPDSMIMIVAHYDHLGMMGRSTYFPGANDNASGVAMLLSLARYYSRPANIPTFTMVFLAVSAEELGILGSKYFAENPVIDLKKIKFLINLDLAGNGDQGVTVVNGSVYRDKFDRLVEINKKYNLLFQVKIRGEACNSDHCPFYRHGVPSFFIYTMGGVPYYHDVYDRPETLPLASFSNYFSLLVRFIDSF